MPLTLMFCPPPRPPRFKPRAIAPIESTVPNHEPTENSSLTIVGSMSHLNAPLGISLVVRTLREG